MLNQGKITLMRNLFSFGIIILCYLSCALVNAEEAAPLEISKDWSSYKCYVVTGAIEMLAFKNGEKLSKVSREKGRLYVQMNDPKTKEIEVTYFAGFPLRTASQAALNVDKTTKYVLYSHPEPTSTEEKSYAWSHPNDDKSILESLKKGETAIVESTSHTGKVIKDTFALSGFTASFNFMKNACN